MNPQCHRDVQLMLCCGIPQAMGSWESSLCLPSKQQLATHCIPSLQGKGHLHGPSVPDAGERCPQGAAAGLHSSLPLCWSCWLWSGDDVLGWLYAWWYFYSSYRFQNKTNKLLLSYPSGGALSPCCNSVILILHFFACYSLFLLAGV